MSFSLFINIQPRNGHRAAGDRQIEEPGAGRPCAVRGVRLHRSGQESPAVHQGLYREGADEERGGQGQDRCVSQVQDQYAGRTAENVSHRAEHVSGIARRRIVTRKWLFSLGGEEAHNTPPPARKEAHLLSIFGSLLGFVI